MTDAPFPPENWDAMDDGERAAYQDALNQERERLEAEAVALIGYRNEESTGYWNNRFVHHKEGGMKLKVNEFVPESDDDDDTQFPDPFGYWRANMVQGSTVLNGVLLFVTTADLHTMYDDITDHVEAA
jgi:hypothetical protein